MNRVADRKTKFNDLTINYNNLLEEDLDLKRLSRKSLKM